MIAERKAKELPILFQGEMIRVILPDIKTHTRRIINPQPEGHPAIGWMYKGTIGPVKGDHCPGWLHLCPYGIPGDRLWVREAFCDYPIEVTGFPWYKADNMKNIEKIDMKWKPSIFMPRWASRILLLNKEIRVERIQDISEKDCIAEGITRTAEDCVRDDMKMLWDSINSKPKPVYKKKKIVSYVSYPWEEITETREYRGLPWKVYGNPWVWVVIFERITNEAN